MSAYFDAIICDDNVRYLHILPSNIVDLVVTSPPYDKVRDYEGFSFDIVALCAELFRVVKDGGVVVYVIGDQTINGSETGTSSRHKLLFLDHGWRLHDTMIYEKSAFANPSTKHKRYHQIFEYMFIFSKGTPKIFHPIMDHPNNTDYDQGRSRRKQDGSFTHVSDKSRIKMGEYGMRTNIWRYNTAHGKLAEEDYIRNHPAAFPEDLARDHIYTWSNEGDLVLDPFSGSGTTCKMAYLMHRHYLGIDLSQKYCDLASRRLRDNIGKQKPHADWKKLLCPSLQRKHSVLEQFIR